MRALIDIPDDQIAALAAIAGQRKISRAAAVRSAISLFLATNRPAAIADAFGLWAMQEGSSEDGLLYQRRLRAEW